MSARVSIHRQRWVFVLGATTLLVVALGAWLQLDNPRLQPWPMVLLIASLAALGVPLLASRLPAIEIGDGELAWRRAMVSRTRRVPLASIGSWKIEDDRLRLDTDDGVPVIIHLTSISDGDRDRIRRELESRARRA